MTPEAAARQKKDALLVAAGWLIQDYHNLDLGAAPGIALREIPLKTGPCDYLVVVRVPLGAIEAKIVGTTLSGVAEQSAGYAEAPDFLANPLPGTKSLPLAFESTGIETLFRDEREPDCRSRRVFSFHRAETHSELELTSLARCCFSVQVNDRYELARNHPPLVPTAGGCARRRALAARAAAGRAFDGVREGAHG